MREPVSLMEFLQELLADTGTRADFLADPHATLAAQGLAHLSPADVHDALVLVEDTRTADFDPYGDGAATAGFGPPPVPAAAGHSDAVQYLSGYLTGGAAGAPYDDVDAALLADDATSFGAGDLAADGPGDDAYATAVTPAAPPSDHELLDLWPGEDPDVDAYGEGDSADPYADPYADPHPFDGGAPATHHDVDL